MSASLITIPLELRQEIFRLVLLNQRKPSPTPSACVGRTELKHLMQNRLWVATGALPNPALPLLLVNHQFYDEMKSIAGRQPANYMLDVMMAENRSLWPTWTSVPIVKQHIDTIYAQFRITDCPADAEEIIKRVTFPYGCGGPNRDVWVFYNLLTRAFSGGPLTWEGERNCTVKNIIIDVALVSGQDAAAHPPRDAPLFRVCKEEVCKWPDWRPSDPRDNAAERLAVFMFSWLENLAAIDYYTMSYGFVLHERILEGIEFRVGGKFRHYLDIAKVLAAQPGNKYWGETPELIVRRKRIFGIWLEWVTERRRQSALGLPVTGSRPHQSIM